MEKMCTLLQTTASLNPFLSSPVSVLPNHQPGRLCHFRNLKSRTFILFASDEKSSPNSNPKPLHHPNAKAEKNLEKNKKKKQIETFPTTTPRKPRRCQKSEASEDFVRDSLEKTFASIHQHNSDIFSGTIFKEKVDDHSSSVGSGATDDGDDDDDDDDDDDENDDADGGGGAAAKDVVEEENPNWPLDAEVGWGIRASEYFEKHSIKNVVGEDGVEIDWEGEVDDSWVKEINCLEWESFVFHPSPLLVLVFQRYNRASDNWKVLKELEKAIKVYWGAKDKLPPRAIKIDINIERDLAYALKVKECPQLLFLKGSKILYREKEIRTSSELVHMIAHFYYNAKKPSWLDEAAISPSY